MPNHCRDIYDQGYFDACFDPWFRRMGQWLNGTCMKPPEPLVMGLERVKKCYAGHWFTFTDGVGVLTDFTHKVVTHLMVDYIMEFAPDYPDQALFSTLEYGVDFQTTGLEPMLVLQAHSNSMLQVEEKIMGDLKRRTGMDGMQNAAQCRFGLCDPSESRHVRGPLTRSGLDSSSTQVLRSTTRISRL